MSSASYVFPQCTDQMSNFELDRQRYLQWREEYKEWCEKYLDSYMEHFHQLPPLPPCPFSPSGDKEKSRTHSHHQHHGRRSSRKQCRSPPSQMSSDSCSVSCQSSSDSSSKSSPSSSDVSSSPSHSSNNSQSPPSQSFSDSRSVHSEGGAQERYDSTRPHAQREEGEEAGAQEGKQDGKQLIMTTLEDLSPEEHERKCLKQHRQKAGVESDAADLMNTKSLTAAETGSCYIGSNEDKATSREVLKPVQQPLKADQCSDKGCERKRGELRDVDGEKEQRGDPDSHSRKELEIKHKEESSKKTHRRDRDKHRDPKASDSTSAKNRKRKEEDAQRSPDDSQSTKCLKMNPKKDIWEEGMKVKPQKRISINIKLDVKPKEDETKIQDQSETKNETKQRIDRGETEIHENKDSNREWEDLFVEKLKSEGEAGLILGENLLREERMKIVAKKEDIRGKKEDLQLWQCVPEGDEGEESKNRWVDKNRTEACKGEEALIDQRRETKERKEEDNGERNECAGEETRGFVSVAQKEEIAVEEKRTDLLEKCEPMEAVNTSVSNYRSE